MSCQPVYGHEVAAPPKYGLGSEAECLPMYDTEVVALLAYGRGSEAAPLPLHAREVVVGPLEYGHGSATAALTVVAVFVKETRWLDQVGGEESVDLFHDGGTLQWLRLKIELNL